MTGMLEMKNWLTFCVLAAAVISAGSAFALPDLTDTQAAQLATADDESSVIDGPALYPLLDNVSDWPAGDESGAVVPDYSAIQADPAKYRGQIFLIEGQVAGPVQPIKTLRPGPWGETIEQWTIKHGPEWDDVAVVYVANPAKDVMPQTRVRMPARFYKIWNTSDRDGEASTFLVFVGNESKLGKQATQGVDLGDGGSGRAPQLIIGGTLLLGGLAFTFFWRRLRRAGSKELKSAQIMRKRREARALEQGEASSDEVEPEPPILPEDPDAALEELAKRRGDNHQPGGAG